VYNWFSQLTTADALVTGSDGAATLNDKTFTSASPSTNFVASMIGEYIRIGTNEGRYKIASINSTTSIELTDAFRGATVTAQDYRVRPAGTQQIAFTDYLGDSITDTTSTLYYQKVPLPLYNDYDQIELPGTCQAVVIMTHQMLLLENKYDNDALKRSPSFQEALAKMEAIEMPVSRQPVPRDRFGSQIGFGRSKYSDRYDSSNRRILP